MAGIVWNDQAFGSVYDQIEHLGQRDNTLMIWTMDRESTLFAMLPYPPHPAHYYTLSRDGLCNVYRRLLSCPSFW